MAVWAVPFCAQNFIKYCALWILILFGSAGLTSSSLSYHKIPFPFYRKLFWDFLNDYFETCAHFRKKTRLMWKNQVKSTMQRWRSGCCWFVQQKVEKEMNFIVERDFGTRCCALFAHVYRVSTPLLTTIIGFLRIQNCFAPTLSRRCQRAMNCCSRRLGPAIAMWRAYPIKRICQSPLLCIMTFYMKCWNQLNRKAVAPNWSWITRIICLTLVFKFARQRSRYIFLLEKTKQKALAINGILLGVKSGFFCVNELILIENSFFSNAQSSRSYWNKYRIQEIEWGGKKMIWDYLAVPPRIWTSSPTTVDHRKRWPTAHQFHPTKLCVVCPSSLFII